jgi:thiol:disulfide interchange protein DsbC
MQKLRLKLVFVLSLLVCMVCVATVCAATKKLTPEEVLTKLFPKLRYTKVSKTGIDGLYEVITDGKIIYFHPKSEYLFFGDIVDKQGKSLTRERMAAEQEKLTAAAFKLLTPDDLKKGIKMGSGKNVVIEVTDPDCPYCRKMHTYWSMRTDVTRYVFFKPLDMHPDALKKVKYILSSNDQLKAVYETYCGKLDNNRAVLDKVYDDKGLFEAQKAVVDKLKVDGTPSFWVNGKFVNGANIPLIESMIGKLPNAGSGPVGSPEANCGENK